jgi:hypothetical protein
MLFIGERRVLSGRLPTNIDEQVIMSRDCATRLLSLVIFINMICSFSSMCMLNIILN